MSKPFTCPYCSKPTTATEPHVYEEEIKIELENDSELGGVFLIVTAISCPNEECKKLYLEVKLVNKNWHQPTNRYIYKTLYEWQLLPESEAKVLPDYIPQPIQQDYYEACRIRDLSPKASATLARRCLQGMIRDFWGIKKGRLKDEIDDLEEKIDSNTWDSIEVVRSVGNIAAHMEKDINIIVDVEPKEAKLLIGLIEQLVDDWYVVRENRRERTEALKKLAAAKEAQKNGGVEDIQEENKEFNEN